MTSTTRNYVQKRIDEALTRVFYDAKDNQFNSLFYSSIYLCILKNKLVIVKSKKELDSNFELTIELNCPLLTAKTKSQHILELLKLMPRDLKLNLQSQLLSSSFKSSRHRHDFIWEYILRYMPVKSQMYFENFLQSNLAKIRKSKQYAKLTDELLTKLQSNSKTCSTCEIALIIADIIKLSDIDIKSQDVDKIVDEIYMSNILDKGI